MNHQPKIRIIAGPNGSGKTTFLNQVKDNSYFHLHNYINPDEIQKQLDNYQQYSFDNFPLKIEKGDLKSFITNSGLKKRIEKKMIVVFLSYMNFHKIFFP